MSDQEKLWYRVRSDEHSLLLRITLPTVGGARVVITVSVQSDAPMRAPTSEMIRERIRMVGAFLQHFEVIEAPWEEFDVDS